jgi:hypothetical protein
VGIVRVNGIGDIALTMGRAFHRTRSLEFKANFLRQDGIDEGRGDGVIG